MSFDRHELQARLDADQDIINPILPVTADRIVADCRAAHSSRVLDLACGTGGWAIRFARQGALVEGVDIQPVFLERANVRAREAGVAERCAFREGDAAEEAASASDYDVGLLLGVSFLWGSLDDPEGRSEAALSAVRRCVRGAGVVLYGEPHVRNPVPGYLTRRGLEDVFRRLRLNPEEYYDDGDPGWDQYIEGRDRARNRLREEVGADWLVHAALSELEAEEEWERDNLHWGIWRLRV